MKTKQFVLVFLAMIFSVYSCKESLDLKSKQQNTQDPSRVIRESFLVNKTEYSILNSKEKQLADLVNSSIAGLEGLNANSEYENYEALVYFTTIKEDKFSNFVTFTKKESNLNSNARKADEGGCGGSCDVDGFRSAVSYVKAIVAEVDSCGGLEVHISKNKDGSYHITWEKD